jgi:hypothetical protein
MRRDKTLRHEHRRGAHRWRVQSTDNGDFDEIVVVVGREPKVGTRNRNGLVLHAEMLDDRSCFLDVAGFCLWVHTGKDGVARIAMVEDRRDGHGDPNERVSQLRDPALDRPARRRGRGH